VGDHRAVLLLHNHPRRHHYQGCHQHQCLTGPAPHLLAVLLLLLLRHCQRLQELLLPACQSRARWGGAS
jgi:hypothetical protein